MSTALDRLFARGQFGIKLGLQNMHALADALGRPERTFPSVIIAGTNGKGSVTAMIERALRASGLRTGRYTSPHLVRLEERFALDGETVDAAEIERVLADVFTVEAACRADGRLPAPATFFELTTAAAFELFRRRAVDIALLEVGLGGRFDATNIVSPVLAAITSIDFDHTRHLGRTLAEIAGEKAGVIKPATPVVCGALPPEAMLVVELTSTERQAPLVPAWEGVEVTGEMDAGHAVVTVATPTRTYGPVRLALAGRHQVDNALVAVRILEELDSLGFQSSVDAVMAGLRDVAWPCRLERVPLADGREILLDAAHNPAGAAALASYVREAYATGVPLVFGVMGDKDVDRMIAPLLSAASTIIATRVPNERAMDADALADAVNRQAPGRARAIADPIAAVEAALAEAGATSDATPAAACVAGSIYLLGAVLPWIDARRRKPAESAARP